MAKYKIRLINKGKIINESKVAKSKAEALRWLPTWREGNAKGTTVQVIQHNPKKRKKRSDDLFGYLR